MALGLLVLLITCVPVQLRFVHLLSFISTFSIYHADADFRLR